MGSFSTHVVEDCLGVLQLFSDGTVFRSPVIKFASSISDDENSVVFKDLTFDEKHNLQLRLYKPIFPSSSSVKLPILFFIHGGGFCFGSRLWPNCHNTCLRLAAGIPAIVISLDYRLAPEHRLPAAVEDAETAVRWLRNQAVSGGDEWLRENGDFGKVFVMGDSSGGNIGHHLAVRFGPGPGSKDLGPVRIRGYILLAPFFGGIERVKSEEGPSETILNLEILDRFWRLSVPIGGTRDHPLANPFGPESPNLEAISLDPILVMVGGKEIMKDRVKDYALRLRELGKKVDYVEFEGKEHGFFTNDPISCEVANQVLQLLRSFIIENLD